MLTREGCKARTDRLSEYCRQIGADLALISNEKEVYYFCGFLRRPYGWLLSRFAHLAVDARGSSLLLCSRTEKGPTEDYYAREIASYVDYDIHASTEVYLESALDVFKRALSRLVPRARKVAIEKRYCPVAMRDMLLELYPDASLVDASDAILSMRAVKDQDEIATLRRTTELCGRCFAAAAEAIRPGRTERNIYADCGAAYATAVKDYITFAGDFVAGENAVQVGGKPTDKVLEKGELMILDLWIDPFGYWADNARTFVVGGESTRDRAMLYDLSIEAISAGERALFPGVKASEVYEAMMHSFESHGMGKYNISHGGHGIGLSPHEAPLIIPANDKKLEAGMVCTLEPGLYIAGIGAARCEDSYLITTHGPERLCTFPRKFPGGFPVEHSTREGHD